MGFPPQHRTKLHSTNPLERLNGEIKRRSEVVGIFPNEAAVDRRLAAGTERRMGRPARPLHEPGNHHSSERCSPGHSADCGSLIEQPTLPRIPLLHHGPGHDLSMQGYELADFEWGMIAPLLPNKSRGVPRVDDRRVLNG